MLQDSTNTFWLTACKQHEYWQHSNVHFDLHLVNNMRVSTFHFHTLTARKQDECSMYTLRLTARKQHECFNMHSCFGSKRWVKSGYCCGNPERKNPLYGVHLHSSRFGINWQIYGWICFCFVFFLFCFVLLFCLFCLFVFCCCYCCCCFLNFAITL